MMKTYIREKKRLWRLFQAAFLVILAIFLLIPTPEKRVSAYTSYDVIKIHSYDVKAEIAKDRKVRVVETFEVEFLASGLTMFYRSLPVENARYMDISATCAGNDEFFCTVADNPDIDGFIDINCVGGVSKGKKWTYVIAFTMENGANAATKDNGMLIDVVPFGAMVAMHNVTVSVTLPYATSLENCATYVGYGAETPTDLGMQLSADKKTLSFAVDTLSVHYNDDYGIDVADGVTLDFTMTGGAFDSYFTTRFFTDGLPWILGFGVTAIAVALVLLFTVGKKHELISVVNIKAPDEMDPLRMGKILDGVVDSEDITSMIYYFAHKGYLFINLEDEDDPVLIRKVVNLPDGVPIYQRTLFKGLFSSGDSVSVSDLKNNFYATVDKATKQTPRVKMYKKSSVAGFIGNGVFASFCAFLIGFILASVRLANGYGFVGGLAFGIPMVFILVLAYISENYRYKWKKSARLGMQAAQVGIALLFSLIYVFFIGNHIFTEYEKILTCIFVFAAVFIGTNVIARKKSYVRRLGDIIGFKEFIIVTEEDKIKFMLEQDPQLYFKVLPYAQVLGVTDEWENKFKDITIPPPEWCTGYSWSVFDYMIFNRCMRTAMIVAMARPAESGNGTRIGGTGGGGSFGGFGGGGFGGGGFGAR